MRIHNYILEITVFLCGAIVMIFELAGSRILAPFFGTSIFVWTSIIGVIMSSLSLGYYLGGKASDKKLNFRILSSIILFASIFIAFTFVSKEFVLKYFESAMLDIRLSAVASSLILFFPANVFLGMVSPYAVRLKIEKLSNTGSIIGKLYALSTIGSIFGTFLSGFVLIPSLKITSLLIILSSSLLVLSIVLSIQSFKYLKIAYLLIIISFLIVSHSLNNASANIFSEETKYNHISIFDSIDTKTKKKKRNLKISNENSSAMYVDNPNKLVYEYTKYYDLANHFHPDFKHSLMIGGAAYSYPKHFLNEFPFSSIDVVEIDPRLTEIAKKYFELKDDPRLKSYHEDGRTFLNTTKNKYDIIFGDAFKSQYSIPYQLTTKEAVQKKFDILNNNGVVILNIISSITGNKGKFLRAEYFTYKEIFPFVYIFKTSAIIDDQAQNLILVAVKSDTEPSLVNDNPKLNKLLEKHWTGELDFDVPILQDDYAPVDYYINLAI